MVTIIAGFMIPRIFIHELGSDVNGLLGTITQIYSCVALVEAGIAAAAKTSLYKPIVENDIDGINRVLSVASSYYIRITAIYYAIIFLLSVSMPFFINTNVDKFTIFLIAQIEGISSAVSFLFCEKWIAFLSADGKQYVEEKLNFIARLSTYFAKILIVYAGFSIIIVQLSSLIINIFKVVVYRIYIRRHYPWITLKYVPESENVLSGKNYFAVSSIAWTFFTATDTILISIMFSTSLASVYAVYNMISWNLSSFLERIYMSIVYVLGTSYNKGIEGYQIIHDRFEYIFISIITIFMTCSSILSAAFMSIYIGNVQDANYIDKLLPVLLGGVQLISWYRYVSGNLATISGHVKESAQYSVVEAVINLSLSVFLGTFFGMYGIVIASVFALTYKLVKLTWLANHHILKRTLSSSLKNYFCSIIVYLFFSIIFVVCPMKVESVLDFLFNGLCSCIIVVMAYLLISFVLNRSVMKDIVSALKTKRLFLT